MVNIVAWQVFRALEVHIQMSNWYVSLLVIPVSEMETESPETSWLARLAISLNFWFDWETLLQWIRWRSYLGWLQHQYLASTCLCTHMPSYPHTCATPHMQKHGCVSMHMSAYTYKKYWGRGYSENTWYDWIYLAAVTK